MSKKLKLQIAHLETEVSRVTTLHTDLVATHGALQSKHEELQLSLEKSKTNEQTQQEETKALKLSLAQQENKFQDYQATTKKEIAELKEELKVAQQSAMESAEAAEAAAATATAAAAAAAAMAGGSDDEDEEGGEDRDEKMADAMADAEASREIAAAEKAVLQEQIEELKNDLKDEKTKRKNAETRIQQLEDQQGLTSMSNQLRASEEAAHKCSLELVAQGEKHLKLSDKYQKVKSELESAQDNVNTARRALIIEIAGEDAEFELYEHVSFTDLARLALQSKRNGVGTSSKKEEFTRDETKGVTMEVLTTTSSGQSLDAIRKAEKDIKALRSALRQCQSDLEIQRDFAAKGKATEATLQQLKDKNMELANRIAREKDRYVHQKDDVRRRDERLQALSDHIEKLMIHLKHEAAAKAKAMEQQKRGSREVSKHYTAFNFSSHFTYFLVLTPPPPPL
jgi:hypothetical protein